MAQGVPGPQPENQTLRWSLPERTPIKAKDGESDALEIAIDQKKPNVVAVLLQHLVKAVGSSWQDTPLLAAAENDHLDIVRYLLERNADVAAADCHPKVLQCLREQPAYQTAVDADFKDNARVKFLKVWSDIRTASEEYVEAVAEGMMKDQEQMLQKHSRGIPKLLSFQPEEVEELACLPVIRDSANRVLRDPRAAIIVVLDGLVLVALLTLYLTGSWLFQHEGAFTQTDLALILGLFFCGAYTILRECMQAFVTARLGELVSNPTSVWNWIDVSSAVSAFLLARGAVGRCSHDNSYVSHRCRIWRHSDLGPGAWLHKGA
eukprot:scaffold739_cov166-Pinguiococcus_pyrenoidosus.AAC.2